mgnify:CR=1 FL=1
MPGYIWDPVVRIVPRNGTDIVYWFADELTDVKGATKIALRYVEEFENHEDVNRSLRPIVFGLRPEVDITCVILSMEDQRFLADIESALLLPRDYDVFLSLDGGVVERQVVLAKAIDFEPIRGKTVIGASFTLSLKCVDLIDQRPAMITDPGVGVEKLIDPSVEMWVGGVPTHWTHSSASITVTQETVAVRNPGGNSARVLRLNAGFISFQPWLVFPQMSGTGNLLKRSCW